MDIEEQDISIPVRRTAYAYVPAVALIVGLANNIFTMLGISLVWQRRIVFLLLISVPVVLAVAWIVRKPKTGDSWLARVSGTRPKRLALAAVPTLLAAAGLVWATRALTPEREKSPRVAVVEFRDGSPQQDKAYLAAALSENLREKLEFTPGMVVLESPDSATVVINGAVNQWKDVVEVTAKLVRNSDKRRLRSVRYKRPADSLQIIEESLSQTIVTELLPHIRQAQAKAVGVTAAVAPRAYDLYLRARYARDNERNIPKADSLFRAALAADSTFARARRELSTLRTPAP